MLFPLFLSLSVIILIDDDSEYGVIDRRWDEDLKEKIDKKITKLQLIIHLGLLAYLKVKLLQVWRAKSLSILCN